MVVVVAALLTVWLTPGEVLLAKFASPAYVAMRVFAPAVVDVMVQLTAATVPVQLSVPSLTVTLPVGVPLLEATLNDIVIASPNADGSGVWPVMVVVVVAWVTVWLTPADVLVAKLPSPA